MRALRNIRFQAMKLRLWTVKKGLLPIGPLDESRVWLRTPPSLSSRKVCVLACFSANGLLSQHTLLLSKKWAENGFDVLLVIATDQPEKFVANDAYVDFAGIMVRANSGYDFGSWAMVLRDREDLHNASLVVFANDSLYGPLNGFAALLDRVNSSTADVIGMTDSYEHQHHIQSYLVFFKSRALKNGAFSQFWNSVRGGNREETIQHLELRQLSALKKGGLTVDILFPTPDKLLINPTLCSWHQLVQSGFPFVKVQLLRENPWGANISNWDQIMKEYGYDSSLVREHLGEDFAGSPASKFSSENLQNIEKHGRSESAL